VVAGFIAQEVLETRHLHLHLKEITVGLVVLQVLLMELVAGVVLAEREVTELRPLAVLEVMAFKDRLLHPHTVVLVLVVPHQQGITQVVAAVILVLLGHQERVVMVAVVRLLLLVLQQMALLERQILAVVAEALVVFHIPAATAAPALSSSK
jgi:hypothetical protein